MSTRDANKPFIDGRLLECESSCQLAEAGEQCDPSQPEGCQVQVLRPLITGPELPGSSLVQYRFGQSIILENEHCI